MRVTCPSAKMQTTSPASMASPAWRKEWISSRGPCCEDTGITRSARANVVGTPNDSHIVGPGNHWLDLSAYAQPAAFTFGNSAPGVERGPGAAIFNLSLSKRFMVTERRWFELRGEAFNLLNHPVFNSPISQTITSSVFGEVSSTQAERSVQVVAKFYF